MPFAYCPSQTNVWSSPLSSSVASMRDCPWLTSGWVEGSRSRTSFIFIFILSTSSMQRYWYCHIIPSVTGIEQAVVIVLKMTWKKDNEPSFYFMLDQL